MKIQLLKFKALVGSLLAFSYTLAALEDSYNELTQENLPCCSSQPSVEFKMGYFIFTDSKMRRIYDRGGLDLQLCGSLPLCNLSCSWTLNAYSAIEYFHCTGKSINGHQSTSLWSMPINIGLKPIYEIHNHLQYYFAIGPRYLYIHQHNHSCYVYQNKSRNTLGLFVNTGFNYSPCDRLTLDLFGEYTYAKAHLHSRKFRVYTRNIQVGGFTLGAGIGYNF